MFFFAVAISNCLIEDSIETQMGVSLISLFLELFITKIEDVKLPKC